MAMGKMLEKYKNVSSADFNGLNKSKFNSLRERWFCYWMNRRIGKLKRKVLAVNKKIEA